MLIYKQGEMHVNIFFFFFNDTATTEIYTLSLHDALPISNSPACGMRSTRSWRRSFGSTMGRADRKSTRLNSSHLVISYAVFCLKKNKHQIEDHINGYNHSADDHVGYQAAHARLHTTTPEG